MEKSEKQTTQPGVITIDVPQLRLSGNEANFFRAYIQKLVGRTKEDRTVVFQAGEAEQLLGVEELAAEEVRSLIASLAQDVTIRIPMANGKESQVIDHPIKEATFKLGNDGKWILRLTCSDIGWALFRDELAPFTESA